MWREIERKSGKPDSVKVLRELKPGDIVNRGDRVSGVTVTIVDDDHADVFVLQRHLMISAGEEIVQSTGTQDPLTPYNGDPKDPIMPYHVQRAVERKNIHITGDSVSKPTTIEWYN